MEWVETTGKSVEEATEMALDQLGVLDAEAEMEVLEEPKQGMFGRVRGNARVRARVRPSAPPPKTDRQRRGRKAAKDDAAKDDAAKDGAAKDGAAKDGAAKDGAAKDGAAKDGAAKDGAAKDGAAKDGAAKSEDSKDEDSKSNSGRRGGASKGTKERPDGAGRGKNDASSNGGESGRSRKPDREPMPEDEQRSAGETFLVGLLGAFGLDASVSSSLDSEGILAFEVDGESLGLLMGPGLNTLDAIQEVCRNSIQRQAEGREYGKVIVDASGARADRTAALETFVRTEAEQVSSSGEEVIFEIMSRSDRKVVHDVVSEFEGVATESVGEDPRRRVILRAD